MKIFIFLLGFIATPSFAQTAKAVFVKGDISVTEAAKKTAVKKGDKFGFGFTLDTAPGSQVIWELDDGSRLKVSENTNLRIGSRPDEPQVQLNKGSLYAKLKSKVKKGAASKIKFKLQTKAAVLGVRGTHFFVSYGKEKSGGRDEWMCVTEGEVEVTKVGATDKDTAPVLVGAGQGVQISAAGEVSAPKAFNWTKKLNWNMDPTGGTVEHPSEIKWAE